MLALSRRAFLRRTAAASAGMASFAILTRRSDAAEFSWRYANNVVVAHPVNVQLAKAVDKIKEESSGRMEIALFPNNQLGGDTAMLSQLRAGAIEMFNLSGLILATFVPIASINGIGFAFKDYQQVWAAMDGPLGVYVRGAIEKFGLIALDKMWDNGYRQITSSTHPINSPEDLRGFKIRVPVSPLWTSMFKALGASPASINFSEVYSALQTKIVEGQENPLSLIELNRFYEVQRYVSMTNHMWDGFWTLVNGPAWMSLPKNLQEIVARNINEAALRERDDIHTLNASLGGELAKKGMAFNETDPEKFRAVLKNCGFTPSGRQNTGHQPGPSSSSRSAR